MQGFNEINMHWDVINPIKHLGTLRPLAIKLKYCNVKSVDQHNKITAWRKLLSEKLSNLDSTQTWNPGHKKRYLVIALTSYRLY